MDYGIGIITPVQEIRALAFCNQRIRLNSVQTVVVTRDEEFSGVRGIGEPDFASGNEPEGVVGDVDFAPGWGGRGRGFGGEGVVDVLLDEGFPEVVV